MIANRARLVSRNVLGIQFALRYSISILPKPAHLFMANSNKKQQLENELLLLTLKTMGKMGDVSAEYDGQNAFVAHGIPGEEVKARIVTRRRNYVAAEVEEVITPSAHRVEAPCKYFGTCTGCQWQHIDYQHQLELKQMLAKKELEKIPELADVTVLPTLPSPQQFYYRNHARFTIGPGGTLGFVNRTTRRFVRIDHCMLMAPWINEAIEKLQEHCGETTQLSIRHGINSDDGLIQPTLQNPEIPLPSGQTHYEEMLLGHRFRIASSSFFQVNTLQAEQVVNILKDSLRLTGQELLLDAYAGVGTFAILLSPYASRVIAIEESASAVKDAAINTLGTQNIEFKQGRTEDILDSLEKAPQAVVLDPPRAGCNQKALDSLNRLAAKRICYVSCDPETLARDLAILHDGPYLVENVQPVDMFPQTYHTECIATLSLKS